MQNANNLIRIFAILTIVTTLASMFLRYQGNSMQGSVSLLSTLFAVCTLGAAIYDRMVKKN